MRCINSKAGKGGKYQVKRLDSKILKWDWGTCRVTSNLSDTAKLANHLRKNLTNKFEGYEKCKTKRILEKLDNMEGSIQRLKDDNKS